MTRFPRTAVQRTMVEGLESRRLLAANLDLNGANGRLVNYGAAVGAFQAADIDGSGQVIAEIDSGIDYNLPQLGGGFGAGHKVIAGHDFVDNDDDPMDSLGHGTEVAGVLAASTFTDGGTTYQGIAPDAKLVALRVDDGDEATPVPDALIEQALQWVIDHRTQYGITVVNISYGQGGFSTPTISSVYGTELQTLHDDGIVVVAAAGNNNDFTGASAGGGINLPAADPNVISVGSVGTADSISDFSNRGPLLDLLAPGEDIETTLQTADGGGFGLFQGTSFSSPIVAGTVALMKQIDGALKPADALSILRASGIPNFDGDTETATGITTTRLIYPRLDVLNALNMTKARVPGTQTQQDAIGHSGNQSALAVDTQGITHYVYYDAAAKTMKYATRNSSGEWSTTQTIDTSLPEQGTYLSLAVNPQGQPSVAYFDGINGDLKYANYDGTTWHVVRVDVKNSTGAYPSLAFDRNGFPVISYYRKTTGDLRVARGDFQGNWTITSVATTDDVGRYSALAVNSRGMLGIAYEDTTRGHLDYAYLPVRGTTWTSVEIDNATHGISFISNAYDPGTGVPWISYYDASPANLKVIHLSGHHWLAKTVASRGATGLFSNVLFTGDNDPHVLFWDKRANAVELAELSDAGDWSVRVLQSDGGHFATAVLDPINDVIRYAYYLPADGADKFSEFAL